MTTLFTNIKKNCYASQVCLFFLIKKNLFRKNGLLQEKKSNNSTTESTSNPAYGI